MTHSEETKDFKSQLIISSSNTSIISGGDSGGPLFSYTSHGSDYATLYAIALRTNPDTSNEPPYEALFLHVYTLLEFINSLGENIFICLRATQSTNGHN